MSCDKQFKKGDRVKVELETTVREAWNGGADIDVYDNEGSSFVVPSKFLTKLPPKLEFGDKVRRISWGSYGKTGVLTFVHANGTAVVHWPTGTGSTWPLEELEKVDE